MHRPVAIVEKFQQISFFHIKNEKELKQPKKKMVYDKIIKIFFDTRNSVKVIQNTEKHF